MRNLIYYPSFEPDSETWLKFALIYFDDFSPIIPPTGSNSISDLFKRVADETSLVRITNPEEINGIEAADKIKKEIDNIKRNRSEYGRIFNIDNPIETWRSHKNWTATLYREKFTDDFLHFCLQQKLGTPVSQGILLSSELCGLYMTFLAESIAYHKQATPITDNPTLDELSTYLRTKNIQKENVLHATKVIVKSKIPSEIERIDINKVIEFRNQPGIDEMRISFNNTVEVFYKSVENNFDPYTYLELIKKTNIEFVKEIGQFFGGLVAVTLSGLILSRMENPSELEIYKTAVEGTGLAIGGTIAINSAWKLNEERRNARKFLLKLKNL